MKLCEHSQLICREARTEKHIVGTIMVIKPHAKQLGAGVHVRKIALVSQLLLRGSQQLKYLDDLRLPIWNSPWHIAHSLTNRSLATAELPRGKSDGLSTNEKQ